MGTRYPRLILQNLHGIYVVVLDVNDCTLGDMILGYQRLGTALEGRRPRTGYSVGRQYIPRAGYSVRRWDTKDWVQCWKAVYQEQSKVLEGRIPRTVY